MTHGATMTAYDRLLAEGAALRELVKGRMSAGHTAMHADLQALHDHPDTHEHVRAAIAPLLAKHGPAAPRTRAPKAPGSRREAMARNGTWGQEAAHHQRVIASPVYSAAHRALHQTALDAHEAVISHIVQHGNRKGDKMLAQKQHAAWKAGNAAHDATGTRQLGGGPGGIELKKRQP